MSTLFQEKYDELFTEFNRYVVEHPEFDKSDPEFSRENLRRVEAYRQNDDNLSRPVVYIQAGRLAPVKSRLRNPHLSTRMPEYA